MIDTNFDVGVWQPPKLPGNYFMKWLREHIKNNDDSPKERKPLEPGTKISLEDIEIDFHFTDKYKYLADFVSEGIDTWQPNEPVVISAQTGSGKNYLIQDTLLPELIDKNPDTKDLMLILSNRIALTRQTKKQFAERLVQYTNSDKYLSEIEQWYTPEGVDNLYINFDVITICSYHQMFERHFLDNHKFKYIICDECHFFTSDSLFNPDTGEMLKEIVNKGQNSIRIYMSATPEIAFEPIVRAEYNFKKAILDNDLKELEILKETTNWKLSLFLQEPYKFSFISSSGKHYLIQSISDINLCIEEEKNNFNFKLIFYYMARRYDYIQNIFSYKTEEDLANIVENPSSKWLIFSNRNANEIMSAIKSKNIECILLSRDKINSNSKVSDEYNYIIDHETTSKKVVISTSVLDNGINIKNDKLKENEKILNIAIDVTDRTEFIQMLGRIRFNDIDKINLYIKENSMDELKRILLDQTKSLIIRLTNDYSSVKDKQDAFIKYSNFFYFTNDETFSTYNDCAIYQLISQMSELLTFIKKVEPDFYIEFESPEMEALKGRVYDFYKERGRNKPWSKSIVDILETKRGNELRKEYKQNDFIHKCYEPYRYDYILKDTFTNYIFSELIPRYYVNAMQSYFGFYFKLLNDSEKNIYQGLIKEEEQKSKRELSLLDKTELLKSVLKTPFCDISTDYVRNCYKKINYYKNLTIIDSDNLNFLQEKLKWIEKSDMTLINIYNENTLPPNIEEYIKTYAVSINDVNNNKRGDYVSKEYLNQHGISKNDNQAEIFLKKYFNSSKTFTELINDKYYKEINSSKYELKSFRDNTKNHSTYYLFVFDK